MVGCAIAGGGGYQHPARSGIFAFDDIRQGEHDPLANLLPVVRSNPLLAKFTDVDLEAALAGGAGLGAARAGVGRGHTQGGGG